MSIKTATAGNAGPKVRSDCELTIEFKKSGGIKIDLSSKVRVLYGTSIKELCMDILKFFGVKNAELVISDSGALPFVIAARLEAAIRQLVSTDLEYLPPVHDENRSGSEAGRLRFSRLYIPGNNPGMMINAGLHCADGIILDLEDSVAPLKKDEARILVRNALRQMEFRGAERMVRINQGRTGLTDLQMVIPNHVNLVLIPKCESRDQVSAVASEIKRILAAKKMKRTVFLMPIIESALGVENAFEIAKSSDTVVAMAIGLEDYTADLGVSRSLDGKESFYARSRIVVAAKAAGIQPIDSVFSDVGDMEGLKQNVLSSKAMGFEGMGCIHPRQVRLINEGYAPDNAEIEKAKKIVLAFDEASARGLSVVSLGSKMIDPPVVARAQKSIDLAVRLGKLSPDWRDNELAEGN